MTDPLLAGAVDIHIHTSPDTFPRNVSAIAAGEAAKAAGMGAIYVKSHSTDTAARAETARELTGFPVYGGIVLNYAVGGLNPYAVLETAKQGGRLVWMPTVSARHFVEHRDLVGMLADAIPPGAPGITILGDDGALRPEALDVLDEIAANGLALASGHLSPIETTVLFAAAAERGIDRRVVVHPHQPFVDMGPEHYLPLAEAGAYVELSDAGTIAERLDIIRAVGPERVIISTDGGTVRLPPPVERLGAYLHALSEAGISDDELHAMAVANPARLLAHGES